MLLFYKSVCHSFFFVSSGSMWYLIFILDMLVHCGRHYQTYPRHVKLWCRSTTTPNHSLKQIYDPLQIAHFLTFCLYYSAAAGYRKIFVVYNDILEVHMNRKKLYNSAVYREYRPASITLMWINMEIRYAILKLCVRVWLLGHGCPGSHQQMLHMPCLWPSSTL